MGAQTEFSYQQNKRSLAGTMLLNKSSEDKLMQIEQTQMSKPMVTNLIPEEDELKDTL